MTVVMNRHSAAVTDENRQHNHHHHHSDDDYDRDAMTTPRVHSSSNRSAAASIVSNAPFEIADTSLFLNTSLTHLKDAIDVIPSEAKSDYLEAVRVAPQLVRTESDPLCFLRCEDFNPWQAARRLVLHWEYRRWLFKDRWLLPLDDESGQGALQQQELDLLKTGWVAFVHPRHDDTGSVDDDKCGRFVIVDHGRYRGHSFDSFLRVAFYLLTLASDAIAQTVGVTNIRLLSSTEYGGEPPFSMALFQATNTCYKMIKEAIPVRFKRVLFLKDEEIRSKGSMVDLFLNRVGSSLMQLLGSNTPLTITVPGAAGAADTLTPMGVPRDCLPPSHGGTWTYDRIFEWKDARRRRNGSERSIPIPWLSGNHEIPTAASAARPQIQPQSPPRPEEGEDDRTREVTALYARRAYQKRKLKHDETEEKARSLRVQNERLRADNRFLESLLQQAADVIALVEVDDDGAADMHPVVAAAAAPEAEKPPTVTTTTTATATTELPMAMAPPPAMLPGMNMEPFETGDGYNMFDDAMLERFFKSEFQ